MKVFAILIIAFCRANADKIIGGTAASSGQFPSIVFQEKSGSFFCGGTLISANTVLTAAHCEQNLIGLTVTAGTTSRSSGGKTISVNGKLRNSGYNSNTIQNDIMLLYLAESFTLGGDIAAAALVFSTPSVGSAITVAGWDVTNAGVTQNLPSDLQYVGCYVIATSECNAGDAYNGAISDGIICIGNMAGGEDTCQGDSGGPAYLAGQDTVAGIFSWGYGYAQPNSPGVYTDVAYFRSWITSNM